MEEEKKQQRSTYLTKAIESFTQPDSVLTKGRYLTAFITFHNHYDDDCVEETVCCISSITGSSIQCYAYIPFVFTLILSFILYRILLQLMIRIVSRLHLSIIL